MEPDTAFLQQLVVALKTSVKSRKMRKLATTFAVNGHLLLSKAEMEQVCQALRTFTAKQAHAASGAHVAPCFCALFR